MDVKLPFPKARSGDLEALEQLYDALLGVLERAGRRDERLLTLRLRRRLADTPLVPGADGGLHPAREIYSASPDLRAIYGEHRRFVVRELDPRCDSGADDSDGESDGDDESGSNRTERAVDFLGRLGVTPLTASDLVDDLEESTDYFTATDERRGRVLSVLAESEVELQQRAAALPLFETRTGELAPRAEGLGDTTGVLLPQEGRVGGSLAELYRGHRPVAEAEGDGSIVLQRAETPRLDLEGLVDDLERGGDVYASLTAGPDERRRLHETLDELHGALSSSMAERLAELPIWPDAGGALRSLVGEERALLPDDASVVDLVPEAPWLAPSFREGRHLAGAGVERVDVGWIVEDLASEEGVLELARWSDDPERLVELASWVASRAGRLSAARAEEVPELPIFADDEGRPGPLADRIDDAGDDRVLVATHTAARVLAAAGYRVVNRDFSSVVGALAEARLIEPVDFDDLVETLAELDSVDASGDPHPLQTEAALEELLPVLAERLRDLSPAVLRELPVFPTRGGGVRAPSELVADETVVDLFAEGSSARATYRRRAPSGLPDALVEALRSALEGAERTRRVLESLEADVERVDEHPHLADADRRRRFYDWLEAREEVLFGDEEVREVFTELRAFPTRGGRLLAGPELVYDADLPELDIDWRPADEIPGRTLDILDRRLGIGSPDIEELVEAHLRPAHRDAAAEGNVERSVAIVAYLSRRVGGWSGEEIEALLVSDAPLQLADGEGQFRPADQLVLPSGDRAGDVRAIWGEGAIPSSAYPPETHPLLRKLGVHEVPPFEWLREAAADGLEGAEESEALAVLLAERLERTGTTGDAIDAFRGLAWAADETGTLRAPDELYVRSVEVETLVGDVPEAYVDERVVRHLDDALVGRLGFRDVDDVELEEVARHLEEAAESGSAVRLALYEWLERELERGNLDEDELVGRFGQLDWIYTDDEAYFPHADVLGSRELEMFGEWRGYWSRGAENCPRLCELFDIPGEVTPAFVADFFDDVAREVARQGGRELLEADPALRPMLLRCYAHLGSLDRDAVDPLDGESVPILARELRPGEPERTRLVRAETSTLFRSDTPTLESMFGGAGTLHLALRGAAEQSAEVDRFYDWIGLEPLGEAYDIEVADGSGEDRTEASDTAIAQLRGRFRALLAVLPRIRKQRGGPDEAWLYEDLFADLVESGRMRAVDDLAVRYVLDPVGAVESDVAAAFDPARELLLVDTDALDDPDAHATGLAEGILPCIYDGPDDEQLVDILVILLPRRTRADMDAYLDRRHFPTAERPRSTGDRLHARLQEVLDFGLHERLADRFPQLEGLDYERWRRQPFTDEVLGDRDEIDAYVAAVLLDGIGLTDPDDEVVEALHTVLTVDSIDEVPPELLGSSEAGAPGTDEAPSIDWDSEDDRGGERDRDRMADVFDGIVDGMSDDPSVSISDRSPDQRRSAKRMGDSAVSTPDDLESYHDATRPELDYLPDESGDEGFWDSVTDFFGGGDGDGGPQPSPPPRWSEPSANPFEPDRDIGPQMWVTPDRLDRMARESPEAWVEFEPSRLGVPHRYGIHDAGGRFEPETQEWRDVGDVRRSWERAAEPTDEVVELKGRFPKGHSQLPLPLYSRLESEPRAKSARGEVEVSRALEGGRWIRVDPSLGGWERVRYEVRLCDVPELGGAVLPADASDALFEPTLPDAELPDAVREWLQQVRARQDEMSTWETALAVQSFVRDRYEYDKAFMERDSARRKLADLEAGRGNHHLQVLHAAGGGDALGRGICYELNIMVAELLRRLEIPSLVSTGWVFDRGRIDRPDHLFAMAIVGSEEGACLMPLDAATGDDGPIRPMATESRRGVDVEAPSHVPEAIDDLDVSTEWDEAEEFTDHVPRGEDGRLRAVSKAVRAVYRNTGDEPPGEIRYALQGGGADADPAARAERLRDHLVERLGDAGQADALIGVVRGDHRIVDDLPSELEALAERGVVEARRHSHYRVTVG